jgi:hypothetical protein
MAACSHDRAPFIIAGRWHDAAGAFKGRAKRRLLCDRLSPCVERRRNFLGSLFPPTRNESPAHRDKLWTGSRQSHHIDRRCRGDIIAGAQVSRRLGKPIKLDQFAPCVALGEASAHDVSLSFIENGPETYAVTASARPLSRLRIGRGRHLGLVGMRLLDWCEDAPTGKPRPTWKLRSKVSRRRVTIGAIAMRS